MFANILEFLTICNGNKQKINHRFDTAYLPWKPQPGENQQMYFSIAVHKEYLFDTPATLRGGVNQCGSL